MSFFTKKEMSCPCCGKEGMNRGFMDRLNIARGLAGMPFTINSAFRCMKHNASEAVGGTVNSAHTRGYAADISCKTSRHRHIILKALRAVRFNRIGIYKNFIHVDCDPVKVEDVTWVK